MDWPAALHSPNITRLRACLQAFTALQDKCFSGSDSISTGLFSSETLQLRICFNASGISATNEKGAVTSYGGYLGWSQPDRVFGFANGDFCTRRGATIARDAMVSLGCCSKTSIYATSYGGPVACSPCALNMPACLHALNVSRDKGKGLCSQGQLLGFWVLPFYIYAWA